MRTTTLRLSDDEHKAIKEYAYRNGISMGEAIRKAIKSLVGDVETPTKPRVHLDTDNYT